MIAHISFSSKNFSCCSRNQITAVKPQGAAGDDEPLVCWDLGTRHPLCSEHPPARQGTRRPQREQEPRASRGRAERQEMFFYPFPKRNE